MNLARVNIAIRQRGVLETVDLSLPFSLRLGRKLYARLALATLLPAWLSCLAFGYLFGLHWGWLWLVALVESSLLQGVFTLAAGRLVFEDSVSARDVLKTFIRLLPGYASGLLASRFLIALSGLAFLFLLPVAWIRFAHVHEVLLLEGAELREMWARSGAVVKGQSGPAAQLLICLLGVTLSGVVCAELMGMGIVSYLLQLGEPFGSLFEDGGSVYSLFGLFLSTPLVATARFLSYIDGRTRRDAWDVQVRFQQVRTEARALAL